MQVRFVRLTVGCVLQLAMVACAAGETEPRERMKLGVVTAGVGGSQPIAGRGMPAVTASPRPAAVAGTAAVPTGPAAGAPAPTSGPPPAQPTPVPAPPITANPQPPAMMPPNAPPTAAPPVAPIPDATPAPGGVEPTKLPAAKGECPTLKDGAMTITVDGASARWTMFMGAPKPGGPLIFFWHGTGGSGTLEAPNFLGDALREATAMGGLVAAAETSSGVGNTTDYGVWTTGDAAFADQIVACAIEQLQIDTKRIYTAGYSAGALYATHLWYARSGYIAAVASYSGGSSIINLAPMQEPAHPPAVVAAHGKQGSDVLVLDFADTSAAWLKDVTAKGAFAIQCDDGSSHADIFTRAAVAGSVWKFFQDHPYGVKPRPYMSLPAAWPSYCKVMSP